MEDLLDYLKKHNFNRRIQKIYKVVGEGKTLVVYGFGRLFMTAIENYDLRALNIVGVSDKKFLIEDYGRVINGFKIIPFPLLKDIKFDYLLLAVKDYIPVMKSLSHFIDSSKIIPLVPYNLKDKLHKKFPFIYKNKANNTIVYIKLSGQKIYNPKIKNLKINCYGNNNYIEIHEPYRLRDVKISCGYNNKIIINSFNRHTVASICLETNNELIIGSHTTMANVNLWFPNASGTKIHIGEDCMFSYGIEFRTSDGHVIYDVNTKECLNLPEDINIGNHVWIGRNSTILKGSFIANNSVIGANSLVNKKITEENCIIAGSPAQIVKRGINWDRRSASDFNK